MGSKSKTTVVPAQRTPQELALLDINLELAQAQRDIALPLLEQFGLEQELLNQFISPEEQARFLAAQFQQAQRLLPIQEELLLEELERIRRGGAATPEQKELIEKAIGAQLEAGGADISQAVREGIELVREELSPSLGLRPTDTPIQDRAFRIAGEGARQFGQLERGLRSAGATAELNFPLAVSQLQGAQTLGQQNLTQSITAFQNQLRQQAFQNRLLLSGQGGLGTGIFQGLQANRGQTQTSKQGAGLGEIGALASGIGALAAFSSRRFKKNGEPVNVEQILVAVEQLPIELWQYLSEDKQHIGPYAEDVKQLIGVGSDGTMVDLRDLVGILFAAVQGLSERIKELESKDG